MYIPKQFSLTDSHRIQEFIKTFSFGTLVSASADRPVATHLPFVVSEENGHILLSSHLARANNQWKNITAREVLVIFSGPHAYISPRFYNKKESVPTWNYIAVHVYGNLEIISEQEDVFHVLESMINNFEPAYGNQWDELSMDYKVKMAKGIVAFRVQVTEIRAAEKLSQNKSEVERQRIKETLKESTNEAARLVSHYMK